MKKYNELTQKLEKLESQKQNLNSLENISILQFIKYKIILFKKIRLSRRMEKIVSLGNDINFWYDAKNKNWIENPKINCRKYCKLEKNANYKKNLKLYQLGLLDKRPLPPLLKDISTKAQPILNEINYTLHDISYFIYKKFLSKLNFFKSLPQKYNNFMSYILPQKFNKLAVNTATVGIKGYKMFQSDCRFIRNSIISNDTFKYVENVIKQANKQINQQVSYQQNDKSFRESLKVSTNNLTDKNLINSSINLNNKPNISKLLNNRSEDQFENVL